MGEKQFGRDVGVDFRRDDPFHPSHLGLGEMSICGGVSFECGVYNYAVSIGLLLAKVGIVHVYVIG